jgi:hypothetical protein
LSPSSLLLSEVFFFRFLPLSLPESETSPDDLSSSSSDASFAFFFSFLGFLSEERAKVKHS